ncbi:MAG: M28 family metallopeptidase, partial [Defluviitaleaceae bacterium]|nr:M28 family metallopeptidase [Defluviitaleaceae bacterium]
RELEAAEWIEAQLIAMGYSQDAVRIQQFGWDDVTAQSDRFGSPMRWDFWVRDSEGFDEEPREFSQNVVLTVPGQSPQKIIVGAHYDSLNFPGASDNASGSALLLESAQRMLSIDNYYTIEYVFFGAEEIGLLGAYYYINSLTQEQRDNIIFMANADVLFEGEYFLFGTAYMTDRGAVAANSITNRIEAIAEQVNAVHNTELISHVDAVHMGSDHLVFIDEGITIVTMFGMHRNEAGQYVARVLHTDRDEFHYINETWSGKMEEAMRTYSLFLEALLTAHYE